MSAQDRGPRRRAKLLYHAALPVRLPRPTDEGVDQPDHAQILAAIPGNVAALRAEISAACASVGREPASVRIIAVTKNQDPSVLPVLHACGITDIGENRVEHHRSMHEYLPQGMRIHAIGRVQGRQLATLAPLSYCLHSLCDEDHARRLDRVCSERFPVFLQVNTSGEASKAGLRPEDVPRMLAVVQGLSHLEAVGLMTMAPERDEGASVEQVRACFNTLADLGQQLGLNRLSMGMSQDFPLAIAAGATDIRIGTRLFRA